MLTICQHAKHGRNFNLAEKHSFMKARFATECTPYKQIIAACGDGASAGLSAFNYVEKLGGKPGIRSDWKKQIGDTVFHY